MTDFWTDKKRGFVGVPGNLSPNTQSLSFQRFMRQELGGLDQTQVKRFTPEGNVTVQSFGMYEKVISEQVKGEIVSAGAKEMLIMQVGGYDWENNRTIYYIQLIEITSKGYVIRMELDFTALFGDQDELFYNNVYAVGWDYNKSKFLIWNYEGWSEMALYEMSKAGIYKLIGRYDIFPQDATKLPWLIYSDMLAGKNVVRKMGLFVDDQTDTDASYFVPLNESYGFGNTVILDPETAVNVPYADYESYLTPATEEFLWLTPDAIRILRKYVYLTVYYSCFRVGGKIAYLVRTGSPANNRTFHIYLCAGNYKANAVLNPTRGILETPPSYLDNYSVIKESGPLSTAGSFRWESRYIFLASYSPASLISYDNPYAGWVPPKLYDTTRAVVQIWYSEGEGVELQCQFYYQGSSLENDLVVLNFPTQVGGHIAIVDPDGGEHIVSLPNDYQVLNVAVIYWNKYWDAFAIREWWEDAQYINGFYVVNGEELFADGTTKRVFVMDSSGTEKYEIALKGEPGVPYEISLYRAMVK